ncbi:MAG: SDR family oxidoreductase [Burkholderiales bacterium]|nr:SDR family oxidoreductase [Burkholderiales bacterium]
MSVEAFRLDGRTVLVTGASSGLGRRIAIDCAGMGAKLLVSGRDASRLADTLANLPGEGHRAIEADLLDGQALQRLAREAGVINGLVHSAGISRLAPIRMATREHLSEVWKINYEAPVLLTQQLLARNQVAPDGSILFLSSIAAFIGVAGVGVYSGSKAALIATMRCLAMEVVKRRIRVNCLAPALVESPLLEATEKMVMSIETTKADYPLGFGKAEDVANAAVFFLSGASRWITGATLVMDGGLTIS